MILRFHQLILYGLENYFQNIIKIIKINDQIRDSIDYFLFKKLLHIQDYFEYILKKHGEDIDKPSVQIYVNKIENRVTFKIKDGYSIELLTPETKKLLGRTENKITRVKNGENVPHIEITEVLLVHCNIVNNDYQQKSRVLSKFTPNRPLGSLLEISATNHIFLKTFNSEYDEIMVWFSDQNSQPLEIEDRINLKMVVK